MPDLVRATCPPNQFPSSLEKDRKLRIWHVLDPSAAVYCWRRIYSNVVKSPQGCGTLLPAGDAIAALSSREIRALWNANLTTGESDLGRGFEIEFREILRSTRLVAIAVSVIKLWRGQSSWYRGYCSDPASSLKTTHDQIEQYMRSDRVNITCVDIYLCIQAVLARWLLKDNDLGNLVDSSALPHTRFTYHRTWETGLEVAA